MLILLALVVGVMLCYLAYALILLTLMTDQGRWIGWTLGALCGLTGISALVWFVIQVISLS